MRLMTKNKLVYGHGLNDASYNVYKYKWDGKTNKVIWRCPFYARWSSILQRCYSEKIHEKHPAYKDCSVCDEWLVFSNFKLWMEQQDWQGKGLDKDVIGKSLYSPDTSIMVSPDTNKYFRNMFSQNNGAGVTFSGYSFQARVSCKTLGVNITKRFKLELDAIRFYAETRKSVGMDLLINELGEKEGKIVISISRWFE